MTKLKLRFMILVLEFIWEQTKSYKTGLEAKSLKKEIEDKLKEEINE